MVAQTLQHLIEGMEAVAAYLQMIGMELNPRKCAMGTTEGIPGLHLHLCPHLEKPLAPGDGGGPRPLPRTPAAARQGNFICSASTGCAWRRCTTGASTPSPTQRGAGPHPRHPGGVTQYVAPFVDDNSDTERHLDHITVQVAKDRARYAFAASLDSLQLDPTLGLTRVPTRCQQAALSLVGTLLHHRSSYVRAEAARMVWEIAGAHGICPKVHYPIPELTTLARGDWVNAIPRALAVLKVGLYNPIECPRAAHVQLQSPQGNVGMLRTAKPRHRDTCRLTVPHMTPSHGHHGPHHPFPTTTTRGRRRYGGASTSALMGTEAGSDPRGHLGVTWGVYLCACKPPLADIILSHPPDLTRCDSVIGLAIPAMSGHIQYRGAASGDLYIGISGINRVFLS